MPQSNLPEPWLSFLKELDANLSQQVELHCFGGFISVVVYNLERKTSDVDFMCIIPLDARESVLNLAGLGSKLSEKHKGVYLQYVGVGTVPENYKDRLVQVFEYEFVNLRLMALDIYDIALSKVARGYTVDRDDFVDLAMNHNLDIERLDELYKNEMRVYLTGSQKWHDQTLRLWLNIVRERRGLVAIDS